MQAFDQLPGVQKRVITDDDADKKAVESEGGLVERRAPHEQGG